MKNIKKGEFGYLSYKKKINFLITAISFIIVLAIFFAGLIVTGTRNNIATVVAIVLVLPSAKFAVGYFILLPHKSADTKLADKVSNEAGNLPVLYDLIFSNNKNPIGTLAVVVTDSTVCALTNEEKADSKLFETSLVEFMSADNLKVTATLYKDENKFMSRISNLNKNFDYSNVNAAAKLEKNCISLKSMCL